MSVETHKFDAEVQQLLNLMVHSLYSNKDIFLRELISNSSDALDRLRVEGLTNKELMPGGELEIRLKVDKDKRTLTVRDNGIGMSREELVRGIGTIARSGTREFLDALKQQAAAENGNKVVPAELIGQFGVGFYSTFMVAKKVTITTRRAGEDGASKWGSTGDGNYTIEEGSRTEPGTTVVLELKDVDEEDGLKDYTEQWVLKETVKKYSDFVSHPIRMLVERQEPVLDDDGKPTQGAIPKLVNEDETLNSMKAIWTRPQSEVSKEEYTEFYRHISHDWGEPLETISASMEGTFNASILLFIPQKAPFDLYYRDRSSKGVQLYVKRVFIMDDWEAVLPGWLRFVKGVIDSEDLSLNVSREILQQNRQVKAIRKFVVKKILDAIDNLRKKRPDDMSTLWKQFGPVIKEGLTAFGESRDRILDLILCQSTRDDESTFLSDYVSRMQEHQEAIYYLNGPSLEAVRGSPHLEAFQARGIEVLLFTDTVDEFWLQSNLLYQEKKFVSVSKGEVDLDSLGEAKEEAGKKKEEEQKGDYNDLLQCLRSHLQEDIKEVRLSGRLTDSPACLVGEGQDMTPQMQDMMRQLGTEVPKTKRILELNPNHPFVGQLREIHAANGKAADLETYAKLLYGQAVLAEGGSLPDPGAYSRIIMQVATKAVSSAGDEA